MSKAFKCDICGSLYEPHDILKKISINKEKGTTQIIIRDYSISENGHYNSIVFDICPNCYSAIKKAIDDRKKLRISPFEDDLK